MTRININTNSREVGRRFNSAALQLPAMLADVFGSVLREFGRTLTYPPPAPKPSYTRTYRLERGLRYGSAENYARIEPHGYEVVAEYGTTVPYGGYVVGDAQGRQAWMHAGRWWTLVDKWNQFIQRGVMRTLSNALGNLLRRFLG